ncbi:MAG: hypothetical protein ACI8V2_001679 [Candidatus Latescibacterota bacterium]|jgi:hypothetical protein
MLVCANTKNIFRITPEFAKQLGGGFELISDEILDAIVAVRELKQYKDTSFFDRLPLSGQLRPDLPLPRNFLIALDTLALKALTAPPARLACRAEELLLWWTLEFAREVAHLEETWSDALETEYKDFVDCIFYDTDFLFLYDPKADGIETVQELGVKSLSVDHWFLPFNRHLTINPLTWPENKRFWHKSWKNFKYPNGA